MVTGLVTGLQGDPPAVVRWFGPETQDAEVELHAMTRCATEILGMIQVMHDCKIELRVGYGPFRSVGDCVSCRTRHIQLQYLSLQEMLLGEDLKVVKVDGKFTYPTPRRST